MKDFSGNEIGKVRYWPFGLLVLIAIVCILGIYALGTFVN